MKDRHWPLKRPSKKLAPESDCVKLMASSRRSSQTAGTPSGSSAIRKEAGNYRTANFRMPVIRPEAVWCVFASAGGRLDFLGKTVQTTARLLQNRDLGQRRTLR